MIIAGSFSGTTSRAPGNGWRNDQNFIAIGKRAQARRNRRAVSKWWAPILENVCTNAASKGRNPCGHDIPAPSPYPLSAREDSARLVLQKTAGGGNSQVHVVKKGEWIHRILQSHFGEEPVSYALIRRLNPGIRNLNRIRPGQRIVLPVPGSSEPSESISDIGRENSSPPVIYRILEGDSISRIILSEMNVNPAEALPAYRLIRKLNPEIPDLNRLPAGQTLRLPPAPARSAVAPAEPLKTTAPPTKESNAETAAIADDLFGIIRPVIGRMREWSPLRKLLHPAAGDHTGHHQLLPDPGRGTG